MKTVITTANWIQRLMADNIITICPRCCVKLTLTDEITKYLEVWGLEEGAAQEKIAELREVGINRGYWLYADATADNREGELFYLCDSCAEEGVDCYEQSENWPIYGRDQNLTRS